MSVNDLYLGQSCKPLKVLSCALIHLAIIFNVIKCYPSLDHSLTSETQSLFYQTYYDRLIVFDNGTVKM